jgi:MFS family permease
VFGLVDGMYDPASGTMPRRLVRPEDLAAVSAMFQLGSRIATLVGAPLGGVLVATGGLSWVMAFDAISFGVIAVVLALVIKPRFALERSQGKSVRHDLVDGFTYLRRAANARTLTIALCGLNLFVGPVTAVGVALRTKAEDWGATSLGIFEASIGAAAAVGAVIAMRWRPKAPARTGLLILVGQAAACACVGFASYAGVLASMLVIGLTAGLASAFLSGAFQRTIEAAYLGRTGSMVMLSDQALMPLAMTGFGVLTAATDLMTACVVVGIAFAALVLWSAFRPGLDSTPPANCGKVAAQPASDSATSPQFADG